MSDDSDPRRGAPPEIVGPYLAGVLGSPEWTDCQVELIAGGKSNLTYAVRSAAGEVVLRRPPLAAVLPTAHDMVREHRVLTALARTDVPVPTVHHLWTDTGVIGAPFYVMDRVDGVVIRDAVPDGYADTPQQRSDMADALVRTLVAIHAVPLTGALEGYGKPDGYLARQIRRWTGQWEATKAAVQTAEAPLRELDELAADLSAKLPEQRSSALVHGDYRLDNTMLESGDPGRVVAVLDRELSTLGDPLADVGLLGVYWGSRNDPANDLTTRVTTEPGFPSRKEIFHRYETLSGRDLTELPWYVAFGYFKLAVIATGIAARHQAGGMIGEGFDNAAGAVPPLVTSGLRTLRDGISD